MSGTAGTQVHAQPAPLPLESVRETTWPSPNNNTPGSMATDQPSNIVLRLGSLQLSDEAIEVLFATLLVQVSKLTRPAGGEGVVVVQLADPSPGAALRAAPRIADQAAKAGLRIDVSVMACDQPAKAAPTPASAGAKATPAPTATRAMAGAPSAALLNDPDRLIFRGRQIWDPTSAPPGTHLPGYIFFSTSASEPSAHGLVQKCLRWSPRAYDLIVPPPRIGCSLLRVHAAHAARRPGLPARYGAAHGARAPHADATLPLQCDAEGARRVVVCSACGEGGGSGLVGVAGLADLVCVT